MSIMKNDRFQIFLQNIILGAVIVLLILIALSQSNPGRKTPARDYGFYAYIGDQILHGKLPYKDVWESKPPAIFYLNAFALWLGRGSRWGIWAVEVFSLSIAIYVSYRLMKELWGTWPALFGVLLWVLGLQHSLLGGNMTEEYPLPLHFVALVLFLKLIDDPRKRIFNFLLGIVFAICFLFRPNNAVTEIAIILTLLIAQVIHKKYQNIFIQLVWIGAGAALPIALAAIYFWSLGLLQEMLDASILYNLIYSGTQIKALSPFQYGLRIFGPIMWVTLAGYLLTIWQIKNAPSTKWLSVLLVIGFPIVIVLSDPARRNYDHYFMNWLPFVALLGGSGFHFVQSRFIPLLKDSAKMYLAGLVLALILTTVFFVSDGIMSDYSKVINRFIERERYGIEARSPLSVYVNEHTEPGDLVLFWGAYPGENFMSNRESPSGVLFYPLFVKSDISTKLNEQFLHDIVENKPVLIVDMGDYETLSLDPIERQKRLEAGVGWPYLPDNINDVFAFIDQNYVLEATVKGYNVYRLKGAQ